MRREEFVSSLSHDLRTPLTIAKVSSQLIKQQSHNPEAVNKIATRILDNIERADGMIRDLLNANRIGAGLGIQVSLEKCCLTHIVAEATKDVSEIHGQSIKIINPENDIIGNWDRAAIRRLVENLATNAIKYGSPMSPVTITLDVENKMATIAVHNMGNPITPEDQESIFDQYARSKSIQSTGKVGWGIGLALVKGITLAHKGSVTVYSDEVSGTTFKVELPLDLELG